VAAIACANAGITFVLVNWHLVANEIAYMFGDCGATLVMTEFRYIDQVAKALDDERSSAVTTALVVGGPSDGRFMNFDEFVDSRLTAEPANQSFGGPMLYTSGTAGFASMMRVPGITLLCGPSTTLRSGRSRSCR
jgi:acyl-coenzyme A synthetase/AMP-(fatty) acid ligase